MACAYADPSCGTGGISDQHEHRVFPSPGRVCCCATAFPRNSWPQSKIVAMVKRAVTDLHLVLHSTKLIPNPTMRTEMKASNNAMLKKQLFYIVPATVSH
jgi:hypothetical protein